MEPDHAASIEEILIRYPNVKVISTEKGFLFMHQFGFHVDGKEIIVKEGDTQNFGKHTVTFVMAQMVHWPEAMVTFDSYNGVLFSADAFGTFGALDGKIFNDEVNFDRDFLDDARRYLTNIVGKYGPHIQALLKKAATVPIKIICPLHGPVWRSDLGYFIDKYDKWSRYEPEVKGVLIAYASMYGNTENAAQVLAAKLADKGVTNTAVYDVSTTDVSQLISETFKYSHIVLASPTYNLKIYPKMMDYIYDMQALNVQQRTFALIENGSWAPRSGALMREELEKLKLVNILDSEMGITSSMSNANIPEMDKMVDALVKDINK